MPKNPTKKQVRFLYAVASGSKKVGGISPQKAKEWLKEAGYTPPRKKKKQK